MKFGIFVCLIVVLAIHEAVSFDGSAVVKGNCKREEVPRSQLNTCSEITCTKSENGALSFFAKTCALSQCPNGKELGSGEPDLTKPYPDCCTPSSCD